MESIAKTAFESQLIEKIESVIGPLGFRVVDIDVRVARQSLLRIFIDKQASTGVSLENCAEVSRTLESALDDQFPGPYNLEVSSPGLDRRLRLKSDFDLAVGKSIKLKLKETIETGGKNLTGLLMAAENGTLEVEWNKKPVKVEIGNIVQANINH